MLPLGPAAMPNRDRPAGYAPRGSSLGVVALFGLQAAVPMGFLGCLSPFVNDGVGLMTGAIPYIFGATLVPLLVVVFSFRHHKYWTVCFFFYFGIVLLLAYGLALAFAVFVLTGALRMQDAGMGVARYVGLIYLLAMAPLAWFLLRALRLRYWQPGSAPEMWEPGDETPPSWALSTTRPDRD